MTIHSEIRRLVVRAAAAISVIFFLLFCSPLPFSAGAPAGGFEGKVVILVVDRVDAQMFPSSRTPFCLELARDWSAGLMVTSTGERAMVGAENGAEYISIGGGVRAKGSSDAGLSYNSSERAGDADAQQTAGELFQAYSGEAPPPRGVVCIGFPDILAANEKADYGENPGLLGRALRENGMAAAVIGNSDVPDQRVRMGPLICSDELGTVPYGDVSADTMRQTSTKPSGYRTDYAVLIREGERLLREVDVLVVDTGDTARVDRATPVTDPDLLESERGAALRRFDAAAAEFASLLDLESSLLLVVTPGPPLQSRKDGNPLTPFIAAGGGMKESLVTSPSTRRPGLVLNTDVLPTVLEFLKVDVPADVVGSSMETVPAEGRGTGYLARLSEQLDSTRRARWPIVITYVLLAAVFLGLLVMSERGKRRSGGSPSGAARLPAVLSPSALVLLAAPLSFVAVSAFYFEGYLFPAIFCAALSVAVGLAAWGAERLTPRIDPVVMVCLLVSAVMTLDLILGGRLVLAPLLGVSALEGMRLYGFTNTLAGLFLACSVWGVAGLFGEKAGKPGVPRWALILVLLAVSFVVGFGMLGANVGGFIAALATTLIFIGATTERGLTWARVVFITVATALGTGFMLLLDGLFVNTHAGRALSGGTGGVINIVQRKLFIQLGQIEFFLLPTLALIGGVVAVALWMKRPGSYWSKRWEEEKVQTAALFSLVTGSLVALVFNDTGPAMMGVMILISVLAMGHYLNRGDRRTGTVPDASARKPY
jgi:hypothetical protein